MCEQLATVDGFVDRAQAGELLGTSLLQYRGRDPLVLGIARGGIPVAAEVARVLCAELDVVVARRILAPSVPDVGVGSVTANGAVFINHDLITGLQVTTAELQSIIAHAYAEAMERTNRFRGGMPPLCLARRVVIVVDDGVATGATMKAALRSVASQRPAKLIAAVPAGSREACEGILGGCDDFLCLLQPEPFVAVGHHYQHFGVVSDVDIEQLLQQARERRSETPQPAVSDSGCVSMVAHPGLGALRDTNQ